MLELQNFKQYVEHSIFQDIDCMGLYHPSLYLLYVVGRTDQGHGQFKKARIPLPARDLMDANRELMLPRLREQAKQVTTLMTALVYQRWLITYINENGVSMVQMLDAVMLPDGSRHSFIEQLRETDTQYRADRVLVAVYEYPSHGTIKAGPIQMFNIGCTQQYYYLKATHRLPGTFIDHVVEVGTEYDDYMDPLLYGREILPGVLHENGPYAQQIGHVVQFEDAYALCIGSMDRV